jgi:hypothetical protein
MNSKMKETTTVIFSLVLMLISQSSVIATRNVRTSSINSSRDQYVSIDQTEEKAIPSPDLTSNIDLDENQEHRVSISMYGQ